MWFVRLCCGKNDLRLEVDVDEQATAGTEFFNFVHVERTKAGEEGDRT